jgi:hypothetical protein
LPPQTKAWRGIPKHSIAVSIITRSMRRPRVPGEGRAQRSPFESTAASLSEAAMRGSRSGSEPGGTDDDTFLEEEDGDDDVSDLIDNDSDGDEEG